MTRLAAICLLLAVGPAAAATPQAIYGWQFVIGKLILTGATKSCIAGPFTIIDLSGRLVFSLADGESYPSGCEVRR